MGRGCEKEMVVRKKGGKGDGFFFFLAFFFAGCADRGMIKIRTALSGDVEYPI